VHGAADVGDAELRSQDVVEDADLSGVEKPKIEGLAPN
jgi:hypothetical protein